MEGATSRDSIDSDMPQQIPRTNSGIKRKLGVAKDVVDIGSKGVSLGFNIARFATKAGFGIASACIQKPAELLESVAGPNDVSKGLKGVDSIVSVAARITAGCQDVAEAISHAPLNATKAGLSFVGAEDRALMRSIFGDETTEALTLIEIMVSRYANEMGSIPPNRLFKAVSAWGALQHAKIAYVGNRGHVVALPEHSDRWMRFAAATFGSAWFAGLLEGFSPSAISRARAIKEQGGSPGDCALACAGLQGNFEVLKFEERTNMLYAPGYLVAVDHDMACVVIALRGTCSVTDALTDLVCEAVPIQLGGHDGLAHGGMLRAAQRLDAELAELAQLGISHLRTEGSTVAPRIIVCGHSLGAGVAALLAALWRDHAHFHGIDLRCVAYACPQVLDAELATAQSGHTTSLVVGTDLVPRFSLATSQDLQAAMLCLDNPEMKGLPMSMSTDAVLRAKAEGDIERLAATYDVVRSQVCTSTGRLYPSGRLIHIVDCTAPLEISCDCLDELLIARGMGSSHLPWSYFRSIQETMATSDA
mmetsp:Transcript_108414/g.171059  ORF Transcript_108414/g.171059 Transcript_108414/m.171059 type:complete len:533 (+) Transcript_108414:57-1655(+)